jgi:hypothetical protein
MLTLFRYLFVGRIAGEGACGPQVLYYHPA